MMYRIEKTESGKTAIGIGGGGYTKTFHFRTVLRKTGDRYTVKPAIFIRASGDLSCRTDQGLTEIEPGDLIVTGSGSFPILPDNPDIRLESFKVSEVSGDYVTGDYDSIRIADLPECVINGASIYHNRDGSYFAGGVIS